MTPQLANLSVLVAVAAACAVPGVFLVLRRLSLATDAISHVLLFGIVATYLVVRDLYSPWLLLGAAGSGVLAMLLVETLQRTRLVKEDSAIGLVFPALFSAGVLLLSVGHLRNVHLDVDSVLLGSAEFAFLDTIPFLDLPKGLLLNGGLFVVSVGLVVLLYKELKLATFDPALAATLGFLPVVLHYGLMSVVSLTAVAAFDSVGPVVVVALFVVPAAAAYLLTDRLSVMILLSIGIGIGGAVAGYFTATALNTNIAGTTAAVLGVVFAVVFAVAPGRGLIAQAVRRWRQQRQFLEVMLAIHLYQHEGTPQEAEESRLDGLHRHLHWLPGEVAAVVRRAVAHGLVATSDARLTLTPLGRTTAADQLRVAA